MLDFIRDLISLNCPLTDWIMAIATVVLVVIAGMANSAWKNELKIRRRIQFFEEYIDFFIEIENFCLTRNYYACQSENEIESRVKEMEELLAKITSKLAINNFIFSEKEDKIKNNIIECTNLITKILENYDQIKYLCSESKFENIEKQEFFKIDSLNYEIINIIRETKQYCIKALKDFYKP